MPPPQQKGVLFEMLDLMGFKEEFVSTCRSALRETGPSDIEIEERRINKAQRGALNGILFRKEGLDCAPTFYVEDFYTTYKEGASVKDLSREAVEAAVRSMDLADMFARESFSLIGDPERLRVRMMNKERNREYLKGIPCMDLGCGFVYIAEAARGEYRAVITEELMKEYDMDIDKFFDMAVQNTVKDRPAVLQDLAESVMGITAGCENLFERPDGTAPEGAGPGFVLTNSEFYWGAGALFYPGVLGRIHGLLDGDYYVLPSSVHELIIIKADGQDPRQLADMVRSANRSVVEENEVLSDDLYICGSGRLHRVNPE